MATETQAAIPSHHARRPMNAFLIFCKRHRNVVKERYPNLENRYKQLILNQFSLNLIILYNNILNEIGIFPTILIFL